MNSQNKLNYLEVSLVEHCNLNCKSCSHFSPIARKEFIDPVQLTRDFARLGELFEDRIKLLRLMGGEPLLHPRLPEILTISRRFFPETHIQLVTNGLLLPKMPEEFFESCRRNTIDIHITVYPIKNGYDLIWQTLSEKEMSYSVASHSNGIKKTFHHLVIDKAGGHNAEENFHTYCTCSKCTNLSKGKLFLCPVRASIRHFTEYFRESFVLSERDYLEIHDPELTAEEILLFLSGPTPFCGYCDCRQIQHGQEWEISEKQIAEWT